MIQRVPLFRVAAVVIAILTFHSVGRAAEPQPADIVFVNGKVFTANARSTVVQGFAVKDGKFVAVGSTETMHRYVGPRTTTVDLRGRFVTPGLADGHFHNEGGGPGIDLSQARSLPELFAVVSA